MRGFGVLYGGTAGVGVCMCPDRGRHRDLLWCVGASRVAVWTRAKRGNAGICRALWGSPCAARYFETQFSPRRAPDTPRSKGLNIRPPELPPPPFEISPHTVPPA